MLTRVGKCLMSLYSGVISLDSPMSYCSIKYHRLFVRTHMSIIAMYMYMNMYLLLLLRSTAK
jgi:hypothetical protein